MIVQAYGGGHFRISGETFEGSIIVRPEAVEPWAVSQASEITPESLGHLAEASPTIEVLLVGCGPQFLPEPAGLREALRSAGLSLEWMDTGAACRTYSILLSEGRAVAAALIAVN